MSNLDAIVKRVWYVPYAYGHTVRVWYAKFYHTRIVHAIRVYIPYAYGTEHIYVIIMHNTFSPFYTKSFHVTLLFSDYVIII